jgi:transposase, IS30 family
MEKIMQRKAGSHLTHDERCQIHALLQADYSMRSLGKHLGVHHSTIVREIKRNKGQRGYRHKQASEMAQNRRTQASSVSHKMTAEMIQKITAMLEETQASPQQIAGRLYKIHGIRISHESIYRFLTADKKSGGTLYLHLRHRKKKYNKRFGKKAGRGCIPDRNDISDRPKEVEKKKRFGDMELDTIVGKNHKGAIVSIVDRASKYTFLRLVPRGTAENVTQVIIGALKECTLHKLLRTLTADNGKEFSAHKTITAFTGATVYFATPYHSWERGLNEHTNGLVRQYFPKGTDFDTITDEQLKHVEWILNNRPRTVLKFDTPKERLLKLNPMLMGGAFQC